MEFLHDVSQYTFIVGDIYSAFLWARPLYHIFLNILVPNYSLEIIAGPVGCVQQLLFQCFEEFVLFLGLLNPGLKLRFLFEQSVQL